MKVLIVGDRPSKYNTDPGVPFIGARCEKRLRYWLEYLGLKWDECVFVNQSEKALCLFYIQCAMGVMPIIALGSNASKVLKNIKHIAIDHPSGLNRKLNNKEYEKKMLDFCKKMLYSN